MKTARKIVGEMTERVSPGHGCIDGNCVFGHPGGLRTNGGCACVKGTESELRRHIRVLSRVAHALAEENIRLHEACEFADGRLSYRAFASLTTEDILEELEERIDDEVLPRLRTALGKED